MAGDQPIFTVLSDVELKGEGHPEGTGAARTAASDNESGIFSGECELCEEHQAELDWFCASEQKLICSHCAIVGPCRGHAVTPLSTRVSTVRVCEVCVSFGTGDELRGRAREQVLAQVSAAREALEEEEQRLLEEVQREEERVEQCLLTQRAHWKQALANLSQTRSRLVHTLTHTPDSQLAVREAEGVGEPCDTEQLNLNPTCSDSRLLRGLWATAVLLGQNGETSYFKFDERTVGPLLTLSQDLFTLTFTNKKSRQPCAYDPARFDSWPNALGSQALSSGTHCWVVDVGQSAAFKVGVCYASLERKGSGNGARLGYNSQSWVLSNYDGDYSFCHAEKKVPLQVVKKPQKIGVLLDWPSQTLLFYEPDSNAILYSITQTFTAPLLPACAVTDQSITIVHK
uniref:B30.2/SPRY domain-containing protein n=1 Tax=Periophthalmus magnuspinnatus TaxID=409849 RepID=A0A3B4A0Y7_9GOBI